MKRKIAFVFAALLALTLLLAGCQAGAPEASTPAGDEISDPGMFAASLLSANRKENSVTLTVDWSEEKPFEQDVTMKVYIDGELKNAYTTEMDRSVTSKNIVISGRGEKNVRVKLSDGTGYVIELKYLVDPDNETVTKQ